MTDAAGPADVAAGYQSSGVLDRVLKALPRRCADPAKPTVAELAPMDEFHVGGIGATARLVGELELTSDLTVLDAGCGLGGPARWMADGVGCSVIGVDLNDDYLDVARELTNRTGHAGLVSFAQGNIVDLPDIDRAAVDAAVTFHVTMNIADKAGLFAEMARIVRPGGRLGMWEICGDPAGLTYPMPWAADPAASFVVPADVLLEAADESGWRHLSTVTGLDDLPPPGPADGPGLDVVVPGFADRIRNLVAALSAGQVAPVQLVWERPD